MMSTRRYLFDGHMPVIVERPRWVDTDREWTPKVRKFAAELGYETKIVWYWFRQISLAIFNEARWPQSCAEGMAFRCITASLDTRGRKPS